MQSEDKIEDSKDQDRAKENAPFKESKKGLSEGPSQVNAGKMNYKSFIGDYSLHPTTELQQKRKMENALSSIIGEVQGICNNAENSRSFISDGVKKPKPKVRETKSRYDQLFEKQPEDKEQVSMMKKLKRDIDLKYEADENAQERFQAMQLYFKTEFPKKMQYFNLETKRIIEELVDSLLVSWEDNAISYHERVEFISSLEELKNDPDSIKKKLNIEIDYLRVYYKACGELIEKLRLRDSFRGRINKKDFSLKTHRKIYSTVRQIDQELNGLLSTYYEKHKRRFFWRGADVKDLIECDLWEEDFLEKENLREEILNKYRRKI